VTLALLLTLVGGVALAMYAMLIAPFDLRVTTLDVPIDDLDPRLDGYTLAVVADLHFQPAMPRRYLDRVIALVKDAQPDLVTHLGDYSISFRHNRRFSVAMYERMLPILGPVMQELRGRDGAVAILGNHDHYFDGARVVSWLEELGVKVLRNRATTIHHDGARLTISGIGDALEDHVDPHGGIDGPTARRPLVLLSHNPDGVALLAPTCRPDLVLSGHTHGGQIVLPGLGAPVRFSKICGRHTASGWIPNAIAPLYVSRGIGCQFLIRFFCPPELVIVRLRSPRNRPPSADHAEAKTDR
jgi:predicted MPP superfamily phosphohydrolase